MLRLYAEHLNVSTPAFANHDVMGLALCTEEKPLESSLDPLVPVKEVVMLQHSKTFLTIVCSQLCGISLENDSHIEVKIRCPHPFGHIVYFSDLSISNYPNSKLTLPNVTLGFDFVWYFVFKFFFKSIVC